MILYVSHLSVHCCAVNGFPCEGGGPWRPVRLSRSGAVVTGTTPSVQYAYTEMSGGQKTAGSSA